jgi:cephalosporin-C deacetylase-like acetyl esterase
MRSGKDDVIAFDWEQYLNLLDLQFWKAGSPMRGSFILALFLLSTFDQAQVASRKQVEQWRQQIKQALFIPNPLPKAEPEMLGSFTPTSEVVAERISYRTEYGFRVPAIVYRPASAPKGKMPAMVLVDGHGGDKSSWYSYYTGIVYARAGAVVLSYDSIGAGESNDDRKAGAGEHDIKIVDSVTMPARMGGRSSLTSCRQSRI